MKNLVQFAKEEVVLCVAVILAIISAFFVHPSAEYADYMNWRVLSILLCLMIVMEGLKALGVFSTIARTLIQIMKSFRQLVLLLVFLCFFSAMVVTNDVALITFVPFTIEVLVLAQKKQKMIPVIVLQTIAANMGSMLTPIGNPQNLYLYELTGIDMGKFIMTMLPVTALAGLMLFIACFPVAAGEEMQKFTLADENENHKNEKTGMKISMYLFLFVVNIAVVAGVLPYFAVLVFTLLFVFIVDRSVLKKVDYCLLITFAGFFIFIGNMGKIDAVADILKTYIQNRELLLSVLTSQVISNVPAAILLSGFTDQYKVLLFGVNIGGLGTLIASMASLISFKIYGKAYPAKKGNYILQFTWISLIFLIVLYIFTYYCLL